MSRAIRRLFHRVERNLVRPKKARDLRALSDTELIDRVWELLPKLVESWRAHGLQKDAMLLRRGLQRNPELLAILSDQEKLDLGL